MRLHDARDLIERPSRRHNGSRAVEGREQIVGAVFGAVDGGEGAHDDWIGFGLLPLESDAHRTRRERPEFAADLAPVVAADGDRRDQPRGAEDVSWQRPDVDHHLPDAVSDELAAQLLHPGERGGQGRTVHRELAVLHRQRHASLLGYRDERAERGLLLVHRFRLVNQQPDQARIVARESYRVIHGQVVSLRHSRRRLPVECCTVPS